MKIDPKRLKFIRRARKLTQPELYSLSGVSPRTIKKYESEKDANISDPNLSTIEKLCKALRVEPEHLTGAAELPEKLKSIKETKTTRRSFTLRMGKRTELELIRRVYGVTPEQVINMAPFLFTLLAEGSLKWRREKLGKLNGALDECADVNHLSFIASNRSNVDYINHESDSISQNDILGKQLIDFWSDLGEVIFDPDQGNPFSDYLCEMVDEIFQDNPDAENKLLVERDVETDELPFYALLQGEMDKVCADNHLCREAIRWGDISIKDIPDGLQKEPRKFEVWLRENTSKTTQEFADVEIPTFENSASAVKE